jgi:hypothetical protein
MVLPSKSGAGKSSCTFRGPPPGLEFFESLRIPIAMEVINPHVKEDRLQNMGGYLNLPPVHAGDINRSHNLYLATSSINGSMLNPGEVFSFNRRVGERVIVKRATGMRW